MREINKKLGFIRKAFVSNFVTEKLLNEIMELRGSNSRSQIIRDAIFEYRKSTKGFYLEDSPVMEAKRMQLAEKQRFEQMTDEEYALDVIHGLIFSNTSGTKFVVMHWYGNTVQAKPVAGCKDWFSPRYDIVETHLKLCEMDPIERAVKKPDVIRDLKSMYDIIIPDEEVKNQ